MKMYQQIVAHSGVRCSGFASREYPQTQTCPNIDLSIVDVSIKPADPNSSIVGEDLMSLFPCPLTM